MQNNNAPGSENPEQNNWTRWHIATMALLAFGYAGYYFCRSDLSVAMPDLIRYLGTHGVQANDAQVRLGLIASYGTFAYAAGKFISGTLADLLGGRRNFLSGMAGSIIFTVLFLLGGGLPIFTLAWIGNRFFQSMGWSGLVKVSSRWYSYKTYGTVMAILSLSFLFGDAGARWFLGTLMQHGVGWQGVFIASASVLALLALVNFVLLRETPYERGLPKPDENPLNVYANDESAAEGDAKLWSLLKPLFTSFPFWLVCLLSLGTTLLRETFLLWTPTYFVQFAGLTNGQAATSSALFPFFGGVAVLIAGILSDRLGLNGRNLVLFFGMFLSGVSLIGISLIPPHSNPLLPIVMVTLVGFLMLGPYSYLAGAMSLDFGGSRGSATAAGFIDGFGYVAGALSGGAVAGIAVREGWQRTFVYLAVAAFMTAVVALVLAVRQRFFIQKKIKAKIEST
jgi:OPA family glycerol-3-phosphate transporter-like MFS transporter